MADIFFAYPAAPEATGETIALAAAQLGSRPDVSAVTWQGLKVAGHAVGRSAGVLRDWLAGAETKTAGLDGCRSLKGTWRKVAAARKDQGSPGPNKDEQ